ncbi:exodeoxyribonuclease III [Entomobacter blattae]|uniref:Exodeoxyribonuclease III n=1 Tax=Entomobacter blattae TaxID=2762277 RepID=A0A7H1NSD3_9PROT|nr:exodeoxyribonuclease III [Entomobacter blattae]QNT78693.1 Exodeoxyribonuclease III [Entomobacter blattae]
MRIMTWNINSLRLRLPLVHKLVTNYSPDILCFQETKVPDPLFPHQALQDMGYPFIAFKGMKSYNGVAIASRFPLQPNDSPPDWCMKTDSRHLDVEILHPTTSFRLHNFYVPAGGDIPDPESNPKFAHKLAFVKETTEWFTQTPSKATILVGDLNIAPLPEDVWSHKQLLPIVSHTPVETELLTQWQKTIFVDAMRLITPPPEKLFTWWSYRNRDWRKSNRGRRLDHIWITPDLTTKLKTIEVLKDVRDWEKTSDHVPLFMDITL